MKKQTLVKLALTIIISLWGVNLSYSQVDSEEFRENIQKISDAYIKYDVKLFMEVHSYLERLLEVEPQNELAKYYLNYIKYRLYASKQVTNDSFTDKFYEPAVASCKELIDANKLADEAKVILAALYLMRLASNQMEAMALMPEINKLLDEAEITNPLNPRVHIIRGILVINMPPMFGGSVQKGMESFQKAISLFEANKSSNGLSPNWGYEESLTWFGIGYTKQNNKEKAKEIFTKVLELQPEFSWVKNNLMPSVAN